MRKNRPPKGFKKLPQEAKKHIKQCEIQNRLALEVTKGLGRGDMEQKLNKFFSRLMDPAFQRRMDKKTAQIAHEVEKEFKE